MIDRDAEARLAAGILKGYCQARFKVDAPCKCQFFKDGDCIIYYDGYPQGWTVEAVPQEVEK